MHISIWSLARESNVRNVQLENMGKRTNLNLKSNLLSSSKLDSKIVSNNKLLKENDVKNSIIKRGNRNLNNVSTLNMKLLRVDRVKYSLHSRELKNNQLQLKSTNLLLNTILLKPKILKKDNVIERERYDFEEISLGISEENVIEVPRYAFDSVFRKKLILTNEFSKIDLDVLKDPETEIKISLINAVSSSLISGPNLKKKSDKTRQVIVQLALETAEVDPEFVLKVAVYTRRELNIRSTANLLLAFAASSKECRPHLEKYYSCAIRLPSDWIEVAEQCQLFLAETAKSRSLPAVLRRAMISKFPEFDEYQLAKHNKVKSVKKANKNIKKTKCLGPKTYANAAIERQEEVENDVKIALSLKQLIRLLHVSKPPHFVMGILGKKYPKNLIEFWASGLTGIWDEERSGKRMKLAIPETWETQLCIHRNRAKTWEKLIDDKKLPFMAMLRNLRNLVVTNISEKHQREIIRILKSEDLVIKSKQFPFRFLSAYNVMCDVEAKTTDKDENSFGRAKQDRLNKWLWRSKKLNRETILSSTKKYKNALNKSIDISTLHNIPPIKGHSIILCDSSRSMNSGCPTCKGLQRATTNREIALLLALMCKHVCESSDLHLFGPGWNKLIELKKNKSILDNLKLVIHDVENLDEGHDIDAFPNDVFDNIFKQRKQVDTLIVFTDNSWKKEKAVDLVRNYRVLHNSNLLYVLVDLSSKSTRSSIDCSTFTGHPNNILLSGFSDQLLRFIAERGSCQQLNHIDQIDVKYKLKSSGKRNKFLNKVTKHSVLSPLVTTPKWRSVRIFISSTFRDMHGERDLLLRWVFPQLRARALDLCIDVHDIDLRWGITEQEAEDNKMVEICLHEASQCDIFLGLLGSRYGTIVNTEQIPDSKEYDWVREYPEGSSITELEFQIGFLSREAFPKDGALVCIRDNSFIDDVPSDFRNDFLPENNVDEVRLEKLKSKVRCSNVHLIDNYSCKWNGGLNGMPAVSELDELGELVVNRLWTCLELLYSREKIEVDSDNLLHENFALQQSKCFTGRNNVLTQCLNAINEGRNLIAVNGKSGSGKTALLSSVYAELMKKSNILAIPYFTDAVSGAKTIDGLILHFYDKLSLNIKKNETADSSKVVAIHKMLNSAIEYNKRFIILLDNIDNLCSDCFSWIPNPVPANVQFLCTVVDGSVAMKHLMKREIFIIRLMPLSLKERAQLVNNILLPHRKKLSESPFDNQLNALVSKYEANRPLFLTLACHQMRLFWIFEDISKNIKMMPNSVSGLLKEIILRMEQNHSATLVMTAFKLLLITREGLLEEELFEILNLWLCSRKLNETNLSRMLELRKQKLLSRSHFAKFYQSIKIFLNLSSNSRGNTLEISHREIVSVISTRCNSSQNEPLLHKCIAVYYLQQIDPTGDESWLGKNSKAFEFIISRLWAADFGRKAFSLVTSLRFLFAKSNIGLSRSILEDFVLTRTKMERNLNNEDRMHKVEDYERFVNRHERTLSEAPSRIFQLAMNETRRSSVYEEVCRLRKEINIPPMIKWSNKPDDLNCCLGVLTLPQAVTCISTIGNLAAVGTINGLIQFIDLTTSKIIRNIAAHYFEVTCICFINSNLMISASESSLSSWDVESGNRVMTFDQHKRKVTACVCSSSSTMISVSWDRTIRVWDLKSGSRLSLCSENNPINCCVMHPVRNVLAIGLWNGSVRIWNLTTLKRIAILHGHKTSVTSLSLSACGSYLASSSLDGEVIIRSSRYGFQLTRFQASCMKVNEISFNKNDLWTVANDCAVKVWSSLLSDNNRVVYSKPTSSKLVHLASNPLNAANVVLVYEDSTILKLNIETLDIIFFVRPSPTRISHIYFDKFIYVAYFNDEFEVLDPDTGKLVKSYKNVSSNEITAICYVNNKTLLVGFVDGTLCSYSKNSVWPRLQVRAHNDCITRIVSHPDKHKLYASVSRDKSLKVWSIENELIVEANDCHTDWINDCAWVCRSSGDMLVTASNDNSIKLWVLISNSLNLSEVLGYMTGPAKFVDIWENCVVCGALDGNIKMFTLDGSQVLSVNGKEATNFASCFNKKRPISDWYEELVNSETEIEIDSNKLWPNGFLLSVYDGELQKTELFGSNKVKILSGHSSFVQALSVLPDETVVTGSADRAVMKWDKPMQLHREEEENRSEICSIVWYSERYLASSCRGGLITFFKCEDNKFVPVSNFQLPSECVNGIYFVRNNKLLATSDDGQVCICRFSENFAISVEDTRELKKPIICAAYCNTNDVFIIANTDGKMQIYDVGTGQLKKEEHVSRTSWVIDMKIMNDKLYMLDTSCFIAVYSFTNDSMEDLCGIVIDCNAFAHCFTLLENYFFVGLSDGLLQRIDDDENDLCDEIQLHIGGIRFCTVDDTKQFLVTASNDCIVKVWNLKDNFTVGSEVAQFECSAPICALSVKSIDLIVCGDFHGKIYFLRLLNAT